MKPLLMVLTLAWGATSFAQTTHSTAAAGSTGSAICEWPELLAAWQAPGRSAPLVQQRNAGDIASDTGQALRVRLEPCASDWCQPGSYAAMVKVNVAGPTHCGGQQVRRGRHAGRPHREGCRA